MNDALLQGPRKSNERNIHHHLAEVGSMAGYYMGIDGQGITIEAMLSQTTPIQKIARWIINWVGGGTG